MSMFKSGKDRRQSRQRESYDAGTFLPSVPSPMLNFETPSSDSPRYTNHYAQMQGSYDPPVEPTHTPTYQSAENYLDHGRRPPTPHRSGSSATPMSVPPRVPLTPPTSSGAPTPNGKLSYESPPAKDAKFTPPESPSRPIYSTPVVPTNHIRESVSHNRNASRPTIPRARVLGPSIKTGKEGMEWNGIIGDLSLHGNKENQFLDLVDEMHKHGLERELSLPRLVVCGKQSSGKSSVLEAITRLPFPRGDTTCTRFVTEIRMIRDSALKDTKVAVTIRPGSDRHEKDANALSEFNETCTPSGFENLIAKAAEAMGIANDRSEGVSQFSRDTLCIEIKGPHCQRISVVDLPGLINVNKGEEDDIRIVESITDSYIKEDRTVILAVVNAEGNVNDHSILEKAKLVDPKGERTFGIITKPDKLEAGLENETEWLNLAFQNEEAIFKFGKGCHVLVNRNGHDTKDGTSSDERDKNEEEFFRSEKWGPDYGRNKGKTNRWHELTRTDYWGVEKLRPRLRTLLFRHTQRQMKSLRHDINKRITEYDADLKRLSIGLLDPKELRKVLSKKCGNMLLTTGNGVNGTYRDAKFFGVDQFESANGNARYLRGRIRKESDLFNKNLKVNGHKPGYAWGPDDPTPKNFPQVDKFHDFLLESLGTELPGNFDPHRATLLFIHYSQPWNGLAQEYVDQAYAHAREFLKIVVMEKLGNDLPDIATKFRQHVLEDRLEELKYRADAQLMEIEEDREGNVITEDMRFLAESSERFAIRLSRRSNKTQKNDSAIIASEDVIGLEEPESKRQEAAMQMIEEMLIYYRIARARYIDNVIIQVVERYLLSKLQSLFDQDWMEDPEIYKLVTHDPNTNDRRREKEAAEERRKNLRNCLIQLETLDT